MLALEIVRQKILINTSNVLWCYMLLLQRGNAIYTILMFIKNICRPRKLNI